MLLDTLHQFQPFSPTHIITVIILSAVWGELIGLGLRWRDKSQLVRLEKGFAIICLILWIAFRSWWLLPENFNWSFSLPLHLCDIVGLIVPFALIWQTRRLIALLYFWGIGFSLQGILTPDLQAGLLSPMFWIFWLYHATIVGSAVYMTVVHKFRPTRKDFRWAASVGLFYLAFVFPIDAIFGFNYGYLGRQSPSQPSLIDWLGPWPWRVGIMVALAWAGMALLLVPWVWTRQLRKHR